MSESAIVKTTTGLVRGAIGGGIQSFKGIPYAGSTAGVNRFRAPQPVTPWAGVRDTVATLPACPQPALDSGGISLDPELMQIMGADAEPEPQGEDCLSLNVWTPAVDGPPRPVMVWFHGGGWTLGSGNSPTYDGTRLAKRGDVVIVTVSHRLGALGYLSLAGVDGATAADAAESGCAGALDMVAALRWVHDNIAAFGGDASNVTIFGESGGGAKVSVLMAMPSAAGLFHKAIVQSGPMLRAVTAEDAAATTKAIMERLGVKTVAELRAVGTERMLSVQTEVLGGALGGFGSSHRLSPVLDTTELPAHPFEPVAAPTASDVTLMIGTCRDEMSLFLTAMPGLSDLTFDGVAAIVPMVAGAAAVELIDVYRRTRPDASPSDILVALVTDKAMRIGSVVLAERKLAGGSTPVFMYRLDYTTPVMGGKLGAPHALDLCFMFDNLHAHGLHGGREGAELMVDRMSEAWLRFARTGDPSHAGLPEWPRYDTGRRATMIFDEVCTVVDDPDRAEREAWAGHAVGM